eukprot:1157525-Pelagomonas_calceolata.AAC.8
MLRLQFTQSQRLTCSNTPILILNNLHNCQLEEGGELTHDVKDASTFGHGGLSYHIKHLHPARRTQGLAHFAPGGHTAKKK